MFETLFATEFMPHGHCYFWQPGIIALHVISDSLIMLAYFSIPVALTLFVRRRRDLPFVVVFWAFGVFIVSCGLTHAMEIYTLWFPAYWLSGGIKAITAIASVATAVMLVPMLPKALQLPSPAALRAANEDLQKTSERYRLAIEQLELQRLILQHMKKGLTLIRERDQQLLFVNPFFEDLVGFAHGDLMQNPSQLREVFAGTAAFDALRVDAGNEREEVAFAITLQSQNRSPVFCRATSIVFEHPEHGRVLATHFEERTSEMRSLMADIVTATGEAVIGLSPGGLVETWNQGAERLYGYSAAEAIGRPFAELSGMGITEPGEGTGSTISEVRHRTKDGSLLDVVVTVSSIRAANGSLTALSTLVHDVTERKRTELALASSLQEKEVLLKEVHHRVKNNLQVVSSLLNIQRSASEQTEVRAALSAAFERVHAISRLHELIYRSKSLSSVSLEDYVRELASSIARTYDLGGAKARLEVHAPGVSLGLAQGVPLTLILNELLTNTFKHAFPARFAGVRVVSVEGRQLAADYEVRVEDSGVGFPAQFSLEGSKSLGLQLVRTLVGQLTGELSLEGTSTWCLRFPLEAHE